MKELDPSWLGQLLHQGEALALNLAEARYQGETPVQYMGAPARALILEQEAAVGSGYQGRVRRASATFKVIVGRDGLPLASESFMEYEGRHSRLYGRFVVRSRVKATYAVVGERLLATSLSTEDFVYDTGEKVERKRSLDLVPLS